MPKSLARIDPLSLRVMPLDPLERLFTITCGACHQDSPYLEWMETPINGPLEADHFQCPRCQYAFIRTPNPGYTQTHSLKDIILQPVPTTL